jgi:non-canonical purine NTP pyrophosphatase (RdgB/HAM1 family)
VCIAKCKEAARLVNGPVIIEDVSLSFRAHEPNCYPGPFIKSAMGALGVQGLYDSIKDKDTRATATCIYAYCSNENDKVHLFIGEQKGEIVAPRGDESFGWDCIFRPKHHSKTYSEMTLSEKNQVSPRSKAIQKLVSYLMPLTETLDDEVVPQIDQFKQPIYSNTPEAQLQSDHCKGLVVLTNSKTITKTQCELECLKLINPKHIVAFDNFSPPTAQLLSRTAGYFDVPILLYYEFPEENYCIYAYWDQLNERCPVVINRMEKPLSLSFLFNLIRATQQPRPQMSVDRAAKDIVKKMVNHIVPVRNSKGKLHGIVHGQWVLTPSHIGSSCKALLHKTTWVELELVSTRPDWDLSLWKFNHPNLSYALAPFKYVPNREELIRHVSGHSVSMTFLPSDEYGWVGNVALQYNKEFAAGKFDEILAVNGVTASSIPTVSGDCGAPTILCSPTLKHKWIGIHILGSKWNAYSTLVTKERLFALGYVPEKTVYEDAVEELTIDFDGDAELQIDTTFPVIDDMNLCPLKLEKPRIPSVKEIEYVGQTSYNAYPAKKTNLIKHPFYGTFPVTKVPSALTIDQVIDPSKLAKDANGNPDMILTQLKKYEDFPTVVDDVKEKLDIMVPQMIDQMKHVMGNCDYTPLSDEDALSGLMLDPQSKSLDMRTSSGEPWTRVGKTDGKKKGAFLTITRGECDQKRYNFNLDVEHGRVLVESINRKEKLAKQRIRTLSLWKNCLKDETRDREKVDIGKTRLFVTAPFESVFLMRKYLEPFKNQWQKCRIKLPHAVGIDPCSAEWSQLVYALQASGLEMNDADFGQFDGRLRADFMRAAGKVVLGIIDPEDDEVRAVIETLWEEMV